MKRYALLALTALSAPALAQVTATLPVTCNAARTICTPATPVTNPDGTLVGSGGGSATPTGSAGNPNAAVVSVQGVPGGTVVPVTAIDNALVVTGDQSYAIGSQQQLTMAPSGGLKVGVSYNANITPAAPTAGGLNSALIAGKYYATRPTWADGNTGALQVDVAGNLLVTANMAQVGGAALTLGQKTMAASIPVTLASDGSYATAARQDTGNTSLSTLAGTVSTAGTPATSAQTVQIVSSGSPIATLSRGGSALATGQVSVTTASTLVVAARATRQRVTVSVGAANTCAFGNTGVTTTTGFPLQPVAGATITLDTAAAVYAACSATTTVSYVELIP